MINEIMKAFDANFRDIFLDEAAKEQVLEYLTIQYQEGIDPMGLSCNMLICAPTSKEAEDLGEHLAKAVAQVRRLRGTAVKCKEEILFKGTLTELDKNYGLFLVSDCKVEDSEAWSGLSSLMKAAAPMPIILCLSGEDAWERIREIPDVFYRVCRNRIHMGAIDAEQALLRTNWMLQKKGLELTVEFEEEFRKYIMTVYPKADLKGQEFIEDACQRVLHEYRSKITNTKIVDADCVPFYRKPEEYQVAIQEAIQEKSQEKTSSAAQDTETVKKVSAEAENVEEELPCHPQNIFTAEEINLDEIAEDASLNVLMLSLSTFGNNEKENFYTYQDEQGEVTVSGYYQMDPVPKMLKERGKLLDYAILLETEGTRKPVLCPVGDYTLKEKISPMALFKERLLSSMKSPENYEQRIADVLLNEKDPSGAIREAAEMLQKMSRKAKVKLYVDAHGGFRGNQLVVAALLSLLKDDRIEITTYTVQHVPGKVKHNIIQDKSVDIFDFTSGINEFANYGRVESLLRYLKSDRNRELLDPICEISEGILWCNIPGFLSGLKHMREYYLHARKIDNAYLRIFENRIRQDYGRLLESEEPDSIDIALWCLKKGFYQQTLTILESHLAESLEKKEFFSVEAEGKKTMQTVSVYSNPPGISIDELFNGCVLSFPAWAYYWDTEKDNRQRFNKLFLSKKTDSVIDDEVYRILCKKIHSSLRNGSELRMKEVISTACTYKEREKDKNTDKQKVHYNVIKWNIDNRSAQYLELLILMLFMHKTIKDIRNRSNHALMNNPYDQAAVERAIRYYLALINRLEQI